MRNPLSFKKILLYIVLIYIGLTAVVFLIIWLLSGQTGQPTGTDQVNDLTRLLQEDRVDRSASGTLIPDWSPTKGEADAAVTIVEFSDFQCPFCKASVGTVRQLLSEYPGQIYFVYRHFPIKSAHPLAFELAHASLCAQEQDKFWPFHDRIFQFQDEIKRDTIEQYAQASGLDLAAFRECQASQRWQDEIEQDLADALSWGGRGTPTWVVNGQKLEGAFSIATWRKIIDSLI